MRNQKIYYSVNGIFDNYFKQYIVQLEEEINKMCNCHSFWKNDKSKAICVNKMINCILEELVEVACFSLIDYYISEKEQRESITYESFNDLFLNKNNLEKFNSFYPMVRRLCIQIINNYKKRISEILSTIYKYREQIIEFTGNNKIMDVSEIDISKGDFHKNTFVVIITNNNQKFVLKKRFNIGEKILNIFKDVYRSEMIELPIIRTSILNNGLVIQEFISPEKGFSQKELKEYYYKFGLMAGVFSIIGSKDLHNENIIATKNGPYFIDTEALITSELGGKSYSLLKETLLFNCSEMGIVYGNLDLSAFSGKGDTIECIEIKNRGMDDIYIGFEKKIPVLMNVPQSENGETVDPMKYITEVENGYIVAINIFIKHKQKIVELLNNLEGYNNRVVLRNTGFYGNYLFNLCLPSYMKSENAYENLLYLLKQKSIRDEETIMEEIDCLRKHIIPYFTINRYIPENKIKEEFLERLRNFSIADFEREKHYLNMALNITEFDNCVSYEGWNSKKRINAEVDKYLSLSQLGKALKYGAKDTTINNKILDYRNDLYTFGWTLVFLSKIRPDMKTVVRNTIENNTGRNIISGLNGYHAGILLENYMGIRNHAQYKQATELMTENDHVDFSTYGSAILALDYLYRKTSDENYLNDILIYGKKYTRKVNEQKLTGLFHGYSGDALVLCVLKNYLKKENISIRIENCINREDEFYNDINNNWLDTREGMECDRDMSAISYGAVGIVLCRTFLCMDKDITKELKKICEQDIQRGIKKIVSTTRKLYDDDSLVNGYAGALFVLKLASILGHITNEKLKDETEKYLREGKKCLTEEIWRYGDLTYIYNPAFASGRIGTLFVLWFISVEHNLVKME